MSEDDPNTKAARSTSELLDQLRARGHRFPVVDMTEEQQPTRYTLAQLRTITERAICAVPGADRDRPWLNQWELQTSNSYRRIGTQMGDGNVLCATKQSDGHPDLHAPREILEYLVTMQPTTLLALLNRLDALERLVGDAP